MTASTRGIVANSLLVGALLTSLFACGAPSSSETSGGERVPSGNCTPPTRLEWCSSNGVTCGSFEGVDGCGEFRSEVCGPPCPAVDAGPDSGRDAGGDAGRDAGTGSAGPDASVTVDAAPPCSPEDNVSFCRRNGATCGALSGPDNCGRPRSVRECGPCAAGQTCSVNSCTACIPESDAKFCQRNAAQCGTLTAADNCGTLRTRACGTACGAGTVCQSNQCICPSEDNATFCRRLGAVCGAKSGTDNCGRSRTVSSCGSCGGGQVCGANNQCGTPCTPESDNALCQATGNGCGTLSLRDRCGNTRTVGCSCVSGYSCVRGTCTASSGGGGGSGGGAGTCVWGSANNCMQISMRRGTRCGTSNSVEVDVRNVCGSAIKVYNCIQRTDGNWTCMPDGLFDRGLAPGGTANFYTCAGTGQNRNWAMPISSYDSSRCRWPQ
jgi:hypothetical protein